MKRPLDSNLASSDPIKQVFAYLLSYLLISLSKIRKTQPHSYILRNHQPNMNFQADLSLKMRSVLLNVIFENLILFLS